MQNSKSKNAHTAASHAGSAGSTKKAGSTESTSQKAESLKHSRLMEFFVDQLEDIYWAEKKLTKTLPKLAEAAHSDELRTAFNNHLTETKNHVTRLEKAFSLIDMEPKSTECPAMKGIVEEGEEIVDETAEATAQRDVGLIFAGQKAEHYEMATYGGLIQLARVMEFDDVAKLLEDTLKEEKAADTKLTQIAAGGINEEALHEIEAD
jgi:ferritin-like metal-binding protein YciE